MDTGVWKESATPFFRAEVLQQVPAKQIVTKLSLLRNLNLMLIKFS
jgi:hypothetical protein